MNLSGPRPEMLSYLAATGLLGVCEMLQTIWIWDRVFTTKAGFTTICFGLLRRFEDSVFLIPHIRRVFEIMP